VVAGIPSVYSGEVNRYFDRFASYSLLVLDDLGVTRDTEYMTEQIYKLVDERYKSAKPMIVTTNVTPEQMKSAKSIEWRRIYDRVLEMCLPVKVDGQSIRKAATKTKIDKMRDSLSTYFKGGGQ
jgi:DNA replication protein DnaC